MCVMRAIPSVPNSPKRWRSSLAFSTNFTSACLKIRMVPVEQLFRRFPRVVRDVAKLCGKDIALEVAGEHTDLDKGILDALAEPLTHLVRNAVDHGIEPADERLSAGKPARGTVSLNAYPSGHASRHRSARRWPRHRSGRDSSAGGSQCAYQQGRRGAHDGSRMSSILFSSLDSALPPKLRKCPAVASAWTSFARFSTD